MTPTAGVSSMVERVARAIMGDSSEPWENWIPEAIDAILAMREPTEEMIQAVAVSPAPRHRWQAMIDTALGSKDVERVG